MIRAGRVRGFFGPVARYPIAGPQQQGEHTKACE
jgi:hypothetical protein